MPLEPLQRGGSFLLATLQKPPSTSKLQKKNLHLVKVDKGYYHINTNEIPGELSREKLISSHVKISPLLWLHNKLHLSHQKTIKVKWFGSSLVFT